MTVATILANQLHPPHKYILEVSKLSIQIISSVKPMVFHVNVPRMKSHTDSRLIAM